ncbi:MAG TPA: hypothetical protein VFC69_10310 [Dysgonamonadaceae bacterium]|nr:hypothetical protein [Dysgonamonadaceae bacterium]
MLKQPVRALSKNFFHYKQLVGAYRRTSFITNNLWELIGGLLSLQTACGSLSEDFFHYKQLVGAYRRTTFITNNLWELTGVLASSETTCGRTSEN